MKTMAKVLILIMICIVLLQACSGFMSSVKKSSPQQQSTQVYQPQVQEVQPQTVPRTQAQPQTQSPAVSTQAFKPVIVGDLTNPEVIRGNAVLNVYNIPDCSRSDTLPLQPVYTALFNSMDVDNLLYSRLIKTAPFTSCTIAQLKWLYYAPTDGVYIFGVKLNGYTGMDSLRLNGSQIIAFNSNAVSTSEIKLIKGWYDVDFRFRKHAQYDWPYGFTIMIKTPGDTQMNVITTDELFVFKADADRLKK